MPTVHLDLIEGRQATKSTKLNVNQGKFRRGFQSIWVQDKLILANT